MLLQKLTPNEYVESIFSINIDELRKRNIKAVITDLDNTLVGWDTPDATPEVMNWFKRLDEAGIQVTVVSNNNKARVLHFCEPLQCHYIPAARKPTNQAFKRAIAIMNVRIEATVVIGDQLFTDVLGGNLLGFHTILVVPVKNSDGFFTRFNRKMERLALHWMSKKGMISWYNNKK